MHTGHLDVVYCHDVEFVTPAEVLIAVTELRRIRNTEGTVHYIGISGYPIDVLTDLAELVLEETGEPLDCIMSYANFTLQNKRLKTHGLEKFKSAGVSVVPNASILGMGLLRKGGVPLGAMGDWHPAPEGLRKACMEASEYCDSKGERLEVVAIRWALETWLRDGENVGSKGNDIGGRKLGVSVMGVSNLLELDETMEVWRSILDGLEEGKEGDAEHQWSLKRRNEIRVIADGVWEIFGKWGDYAWASPREDYVRVHQPEGES
jgi:D-arabinose 1-dehydrogenase